MFSRSLNIKLDSLTNYDTANVLCFQLRKPLKMLFVSLVRLFILSKTIYLLSIGVPVGFRD